MSRRKQKTPLHLIPEEDLALELERGTQLDSPTTSDDAHVCGKCRAEFDALPHFLSHKKTCCRQRLVLFDDHDQSDDELQSGDSQLEALHTDAENSDRSVHLESKGTGNDTSCAEDTVNELLTPSTSVATPSNNMNSNVFLEPLLTTKAAVQQFAENNLPTADLAVLHSTLFSLQQQQLIQLQLIQQLQSQLTGSESSSAMSSAIPSILHLPSSGGVASTTNSADLGVNSPPLPATSQSSFELLRKEAEKIITSCASPLTPLLSSESEKVVPPNVTVGSKEEAPSSDPYFKHKCRYCQKVFGSDSALQIHLRSHTGERPFKCNICGNRFSTRGNLKVHFMRHRTKYPHVRMNTAPVPEYLDKPDHSAPPSSLLLPPSSQAGNSRDLRSPTSIPSSGPPSTTTMSPPVETNKEPNLPMSEQQLHSSSSLSIPDLSQMTSVAVPTFSNPLMRNAGMLSSFPGTMLPVPPPVPSFPTFPGMFRPSILPENDPSDSMEEFMEISKSETDKLQQLVESLNTKVSDPNQCVICHRVLSCKSALQMHYRIHTGERPYKCKLCSRAFTTKGNLKTHMGVHRSKPPLRMMHQCPVCHKQFTNALVLQQHIRMHTESAGLPSTVYGSPPSGPAASGSGELDLRIHRPSSASLHSPGQDSLVRTQSVKSEPSEDKPERPDSVGGGSERDGSSSSISPTPQSASGLSASAYVDANGNPPSFASPYSTSLAALEERVRAMDSQLKQSSMTRPWEQEPRYTLLSPSGDKPSDPTQPLNIETDNEQKGDVDEPMNLEKSVARQQEVVTPNLAAPISPESYEGEPESPTSKDGDAANALSPYPESNASAETNPATEGSSKASDSLNPTTCNICFKSFACRSALEIHYRMHTKERPYNCEVCGRGFTTRGNMRQHMLTHKIRDLPSEVFEPVVSPASSETSAVSEVKKEATHSSPQETVAPTKRPCPSENGSSRSSPPPKRPLAKHQCSVCYKPFSSASALQIHFRTHTGDKPYKCNVCGKAFTTKGNLKVHMGTHMWNNGATRRGRRVSVENVNLLPSNMLPNKDSHKQSPVTHFPAPSPDMFFPYPPFMNGFSPNKMSDLHLMPGMTGLPSVSAAEALMQMQASTAQAMLKAGYMPMLPGFPPMTNPGDLTKLTSPFLSNGDATSLDETTNSRAPSTSPTSSEKESPKSAWAWKTTCYVCNKVCSSVSSLDQHMKTAHGPPSESGLPLAATS